MGIILIYLHAGGVPHIVKNLLMTATTLLETTLQLEVYTKKLWASKVVGNPISPISRFPSWGFRDKMTFGCRSHGKPIMENIIKGKVVASPKFELWWVLWVCVCLWFIRAPKVLQLRINQLVVWFVQVRVNNWPSCHSS